MENSHVQLPTTGLIVILGENGSGKSTLLRIIMGDEKFVGSYVFNGQKAEKKTLTDYISYVNPSTPILKSLTVLENIMFLYKKCEKERALAIIKSLGLDEVSETLAGNLSLGEKRRLSLAVEIYGNKPILLLDEPFISLDEKNQQKIAKFLNLYSQDHLVLITNHENISILEKTNYPTYSIADKKINIGETVDETDFDNSERYLMKKASFLLGKTLIKHPLYFIFSFIISTVIMTLLISTSYITTDLSASDRFSFDSSSSVLSFMFFKPKVFEKLDVKTQDEFKSRDDFIDVYDCRSWNINSKYEGHISDEMYNYTNAIIYVKNNVFQDYSLIEGSVLPQNSNEILVPSCIANLFVQYHLFDSPNELLNAKLNSKKNIDGVITEVNKTVVGIYNSPEFSDVSQEKIKVLNLTEHNYYPYFALSLDYGFISLADKEVPTITIANRLLCAGQTWITPI